MPLMLRRCLETCAGSGALVVVAVMGCCSSTLDEVHHYYPPNVSGTPTLGLYQPRALCAVAPHLLPGLRCEEDFWRGFRAPPRAR
eukprot:scaffold66073_cov75-Phaeocystis_antarctica.AAC.1